MKELLENTVIALTTLISFLTFNRIIIGRRVEALEEAQKNKVDKDHCKECPTTITVGIQEKWINKLEVGLGTLNEKMDDHFEKLLSEIKKGR